MKITIGRLRSIISEVLEKEAESEIDELRSEPQTQDIKSFTDFKLDNNEYEYGFAELQALARNLSAIRLNRTDLSEPSPIDVDKVKKELADIGFTFVGRKPIKQTRGYKTALGTHPFANSGGGGSGSVAIKFLSGLTPANTIAVTVGAGGTGVSAGTGNPGGNSTIASGTQTITTVTANGGGGGFVTAAISPGGAGGAGGLCFPFGLALLVVAIGIGGAGGRPSTAIHEASPCAEPLSMTWSETEFVAGVATQGTKCSSTG
jgi:hypothetical protein